MWNNDVIQFTLRLTISGLFCSPFSLAFLSIGKVSLLTGTRTVLQIIRH